MRELKIERWGIFPICIGIQDLRRTEFAFIKLLNPPLNTLMRRHTYSSLQTLQNASPFQDIKRFQLHTDMIRKITIDYLGDFSFHMFFVDGLKFIDLYYLLMFYKFIPPIKVVIKYGAFSSLSTKKIRRNVILEGHFIEQREEGENLKKLFKNTNEFLRILKTREFIMCYFSNIEKKYIDPLKIVKRLVKNRKRLRFIIFEYSDSEIIATYKLIKNSKINNKFWEIANYRLAYVLRKRLGFVPTKNIVIKIPFAFAYSKQKIKQLFLTRLPTYVSNLKKYILKINIKVVFIRRKNIADLLLNYIAFAKNIKTKDKNITCKCKQCIPQQLIIRANDGKCVNSKFIPQPDIKLSKWEIINAINNTLYKNRVYGFIRSLNECPDEILQDIQKHSVKSSNILQQIKILKIEHKHKVCTIMDKNNGAMYSFCPIFVKQKTIDLFECKNDNSNYCVINEIEDDIKKLWEIEYKKCNIDFGKIRLKGSIPYAYAIPKFKDFDRFRPIISYANHPLKNVYNIVSRGLMFLLEQFAPKSVLFKIKDLLKNIKVFLESVQDNVDFYMLTFDIKNMYTNLPQKQISTAIMNLFQLAKHVKRTKWITINKRGVRGVRWGKYVDRVSTVQIQYFELLKLVELDINNCYFKLGDQIMKQIIGIPMGGPTSPPCSIILCAMAEINWQKQLKHLHIFNNTFFTRYVDDGLIITMNGVKYSAKQNAHLLLQILKKLYPDTLTLLIESEGNEVDFLEMKLKIINKQILTYHKNKNYEHIRQGEGQKFLNLIHFQSFTPIQQKIGVVMGSMLRVTNLANTYTQKMLDALQLFWEFVFLGYNKKTLLKAIYKLEHRNVFMNEQSKLWRDLRNIIKCLKIK